MCSIYLPFIKKYVYSPNDILSDCLSIYTFHEKSTPNTVNLLLSIFT